MKKKFMIFVALFVFFLGISNVNAMTLKPSGATSAKRGDEITLYITLSRSASEKAVSAVDGTLSYDSNVLQLISSTNLMTGWTQFAGVSNGNTFGYGNLAFDNLITNTSQNIVKMVFKVNSGANSGNTAITISSPSATDEVGGSVSITGGTHNVKVLSDVNTLTDITISNGTINFNENTTEYNVTIDSNSTNISATKKDGSSSISGDIGNKILNYGVNTFKITVTSESGKSKVYTINITRPDNRSKTNTLSSLKLSSGTIAFNKNTTNYKVTVENNISSIKVEATLTDKKSSFVSGYEPRVVNLNVGNNNIEIKIKAENEEVKTYTINVVRKDVDKPSNNDSNNKPVTKEETKKSNNNNLSELKLSDGILVFDKGTTEYRVTVSYDVKSIEITAKTEDSKAKFEILNNEELSIGENVITIKVVAEDNSEKEYKIIVIRKEENAILSSDSKLKSLIIKDYEIDFNSSVYNYTIKIGKEDKLNITYTPSDSKSNVTVTGNENLENGSIIEISVVAEDGNVSTYKINIEKSNSNYVFIIFLVIVLLGGLISLVIILIKSRKKNDAEYEQLVSSESAVPIQDVAVVEPVVMGQQDVPIIQSQQIMSVESVVSTVPVEQVVSTTQVTQVESSKSTSQVEQSIDSDQVI